MTETMNGTALYEVRMFGLGTRRVEAKDAYDARRLVREQLGRTRLPAGTATNLVKDARKESTL